MSAPASTHDMGEIASRLRRICDEVARLGAEITEVSAAVSQATSSQTDAAHGAGPDGAVFTPREAAKLLGRSPSWTNDRIRDGSIPAIRVGTRWLLRRSDLVAGGWL